MWHRWFLLVLLQVVADLLTLAGIRGSPELKRPRSQGAVSGGKSTGPSKRQENTHHHQGTHNPGDDEVGCGGGCDSGGVRGCGGGTRIITGDGDAAVARFPDEDSSGSGRGVDSGAQGGAGIAFVSAAARPTTKGRERVRPIGHPSGRQRSANSSGGGGGASEGDRAAPAWEGSFREGDADIPSADEVSLDL